MSGTEATEVGSDKHEGLKSKLVGEVVSLVESEEYDVPTDSSWSRRNVSACEKKKARSYARLKRGSKG